MTTDADRSGIDVRSIGSARKFSRGRRGRQPRGELAHGVDRVGVLIDGVDLAASAQQIDEVAAPAAAGVEDTVARRDSAAQQLIEQIDVDPAELGLEIHRGVNGLYLLTGRGAPPRASGRA